MLLWPESTTERARGALHQTLYVVRQAFGESSVVGTNELRLDPGTVWSDVAEFQAALARGDLAGAVDLYGGPFLDAFHVAGAPELERWVDQKRQELARSYQASLSRLTAQAMEGRDFARAVACAERLVAADPLSGRATVMLMEALAASGDITAALERARVHASVVRHELGADVDPAVGALAARLRAETIPAEALVALDVRTATHRNSGETVLSGNGILKSRWRKRSVALAAAMAVVVTGAMAIRRPADRGREFVVVADFATAPADSGIADFLTVATRRALSASRALGSVPESRVGEARKRLHMPKGAKLDVHLSRQVAIGLGIRTVIDGSLDSFAGGHYALSIRLRSASSGDVLVSAERTDVSPDRLIGALDTLARTLRERAGDQLEAIRAEPSLMALTSTSLEAMSNYAAALRAPNDQAIELLREAVALDTSFAAAYWQLAYHLENVRGADEERRGLLVKAYSHREGLTEYERLRVEAAYLYTPDGKTENRERLVERLRQIVEKYPNADDALTLASFYLKRREWEAAESTFHRAIAFDSTRPNAYAGVISALLGAGRIAAARKAADALGRRFPGPNLSDASVAYAEGRRDRVREVFLAKTRSATGPDVIPAHRKLALLNLLEGRVADWEREIRTIAALDSAAPGWLATPLDVPRANYWVRNRRAEAVRMLDSALATDPAQRRNPTIAMIYAWMYAGFERPTQARSLLAASDSTAKAGFTQENYRRVAMGWILVAEGKPLDGIVALRGGQMLPDGPISSSPIIFDPDIGRAFERAGLPDSAIAAYEHFLNTPVTGRLIEDAFSLAWVLERAGALYEAKGRRKEASAVYARLVELWRDADPELQPRVIRARQRIEALSTMTR